jgi:hypothetical protein
MCSSGKGHEFPLFWVGNGYYDKKCVMLCLMRHIMGYACALYYAMKAANIYRFFRFSLLLIYVLINFPKFSKEK